MVDYSAPLRAAQQGLMTGVQLGGRMRENRQNREIGGLMAGGDYKGASAAAFTGGDLRTGQAIQAYEQQQQGVQRGQQRADALKAGHWDKAMTFASSPEEMAQVTEFRDKATAAEREQVVRQAGQMATVLEAIQSLPPEQQLAAAQRYAPQFGVDPAALTAENLTPQALEAYRIQALGLKDYLSFQQKERDATRPIVTPYGIMMPPGGQVPGMGGQPQQGGSEFLDALPPGATIRPRPNQAPSASAGGAERNQPVSVSFQNDRQARQSIERLVPGVRFTSGARTQADNRRVGGAPRSFHTQGRAWDLVPPSGTSMAQLAQTMRQSGFRVLDEGDHVHVSW